MQWKLFRPVLAIVLVVSLVLGSAVWLWLSQKTFPPPAKKTPPVEKEYHWYVRFSVKNQSTSAYVGEADATLSASGNRYFIGAVAVHPLYSGASPLAPIIPFGTTLFLDAPITVQGQSRNAFKVIDTGDVKFGRFGSYPYWFDIYWGAPNDYNTREALVYGTKLVDYYWIEPWR